MRSFTARKRGWGRKSFSHAQGGGHNWGSFYVVAGSFSHIEEGAQERSTFYKAGREKFNPVLRGGGGTKSFRPAIFPFCSSHPPRN